MTCRVDLHLHLLPGVDDGAPDEPAALEHAARMVAGGVRQAAVTPHVGHPHFALDVATVVERTRALQAALDGAGLPLRLVPGGEIHPRATHDLGARELDRIAHGPPGARWVLVEVPFAGIDSGFLEGCAVVRARGFGIVVAHPERAARFHDEGLHRLGAELAAGSVLQVNACSLMGRHGPEVQRAAAGLVRSGLAYLIASDGHPPRRPQTLGDGAAAARAAGASAGQARRLTEANPAFLLRRGLVADGAGRRSPVGHAARPE